MNGGLQLCMLHLSLAAKRCTVELDRLTYWSSRKIIKGPSIHLSIQGVCSESYYRAPDRRANYTFRVSSINVSIIFRWESCPGFHLLVAAIFCMVYSCFNSGAGINRAPTYFFLFFFVITTENKSRGSRSSDALLSFISSLQLNAD